METTKSQSQAAPSVCTTFQIIFASYFAGPIAGCYFLGQNFKTFGKLKAYKLSLYLGFISTFLLASIFYFISDSIVERIPKTMFPIVYTSFIMGYVFKLENPN